MKITEVDLKLFRRYLEDALPYHARKTGIKFEDFPDFQFTPEKPYTARTVVPVTFETQYSTINIGEFFVLALTRGDGTGSNSKKYNLDNLIVPEEFNYKDYKPDRVVPRDKTETNCEGCFSLFSINEYGCKTMFTTSLDELGVINNKITRLWTLGLNPLEYQRALRGGISMEPQIYLTVGDSANEARIGNPHAILYNPNTADGVQVVGFYAIPKINPDNPILENSRRWIRPSGC